MVHGPDAAGVTENAAARRSGVGQRGGLGAWMRKRCAAFPPRRPWAALCCGVSRRARALALSTVRLGLGINRGRHGGRRPGGGLLTLYRTRQRPPPRPHPGPDDGRRRPGGRPHHGRCALRLGHPGPGRPGPVRPGRPDLDQGDGGGGVQAGVVVVAPRASARRCCPGSSVRALRPGGGRGGPGRRGWAGQYPGLPIGVRTGVAGAGAQPAGGVPP